MKTTEHHCERCVFGAGEHAEWCDWRWFNARVMQLCGMDFEGGGPPLGIPDAIREKAFATAREIWRHQSGRPPWATQ